MPKTIRFPRRWSVCTVLSDDGVDRRIVGADDEGVANPDRLDPLPDHARRERVEVELDVGQLGHTSGVPRGGPALRQAAFAVTLHSCSRRLRRAHGLRPCTTTRRDDDNDVMLRPRRHVRASPECPCAAAGHVSTALPLAATPALRAGVAGVRIGRSQAASRREAACDRRSYSVTARSAATPTGSVRRSDSQMVLSYVVSSCRRLVLARSASAAGAVDSEGSVTVNSVRTVAHATLRPYASCHVRLVLRCSAAVAVVVGALLAPVESARPVVAQPAPGPARRRAPFRICAGATSGRRAAGA